MKPTIETPSGHRLTVEPLLLLDVDATDLFDGESIDWKYCVENASFAHKDACEFILYIGWEADSEEFDDKIREMTSYGCSEDLIALVKMANTQQASCLMLHA
jgi:hypothetical protein